MTRDDGNPGERGAQCAREALLMRRVTEREQQRDGDGFRPQGANGVDHTRHFIIGQRRQRPIRPHPLDRPHHVVARHEGRRMVAREIVQ